MATTKATELAQFAKTLTVDGSGNTTLTGTVTAPAISNTGGGIYVDSAEVSGLIDSAFSAKSTDNLSEGSNLYYTTARADSDAKAAISVTDAGGDGSLSYSAGTITYTGPSASEVRAHFSAGTGVSISSGQVSIGQSVGTSDNVTFANGTFTGDLTVSGTTTYVNTTTLNIGDNIITLNADETGTPSQNAGIEVERGTTANVSFVWDETNDRWSVGTEDLFFDDNAKAVFGASSDLQIYHDGSNSYFTESGTGRIYVTTNGPSVILGKTNGENMLIANADGAVDIYYDNIKKLATTSGGIDVTGTVTADGLSLGDGQRAYFGAGNDLEIFSDGNTSYIKDNGTGDLRIWADNPNIATAGGNKIFYGNNGVAELYYTGGVKRLETTSGGIDVTGTAVTDGLTVAGNVSVDGGSIKLDGNYPTGTGNVALGNQALDDASLSGSFNTAIGNASLSLNTTGNSNVGLGHQTLDANTTGGFNNAIGSNSLGANTTGAQNTAVGHNTLAANTTANSNTAIGYQSLYTNTTGANNVALGTRALDANTTAGSNVAIGVDAMGANTTGTRNTAVGTNALDANVTGTDNVAVGQGAGTNNTTSFNTFIGRNAGALNTTGAFQAVLGERALYANTTGQYLTALGREALAANTTASSNTAVGAESLHDNTTGVNNTAVGAFALDANTTGGENTAVGRTALSDNTTGAYNTAVGRDALKSNTTANNNTAVGQNSLLLNTTGGYNIGLGNQALESNTTGNANIAIGYQALETFNNTTGGYNHNVAIGYGAGRYTTTGNFNTAIGGLALRNNTTASRNTGIGYQTLYQNTTGNDNVAIGSNALQENTIGYQNIGIGTRALDSTTSGNECVAIGHEAGNTATTAVANTMIGRLSGRDTSGGYNTFLGHNSGYLVQTGTNNTIVGRYNGNQNGLDIRTASNYIVFAGGDGNPRAYFNGSSWVFNKAAVAPTHNVSSASGAYAQNFDTYQHFKYEMSGNVTLNNPTTEKAGQSGHMIFIQDATGGRTLSLGTDYETVGGAGITLSTAPNATDIVPYVVLSSGRILLGTPQLAFA